jgi:hypothetical protein
MGIVMWMSMLAEAHGREGPSEDCGVSVTTAAQPPAFVLHHGVAIPSSPSAETAMMEMEAHMEMTHRCLRGHVRRVRDLQQELEVELEAAMI